MNMDNCGCFSLLPEELIHQIFDYTSPLTLTDDLRDKKDEKIITRIQVLCKLAFVNKDWLKCTFNYISALASKTFTLLKFDSIAQRVHYIERGEYLWAMKLYYLMDPKKLLETYSSSHLFSEENLTVLHSAVNQNKFYYVKLFLNIVKRYSEQERELQQLVNWQTSRGNTPLLKALKSGNSFLNPLPCSVHKIEAIVEILLNHAANPNIFGNDKERGFPLYYALTNPLFEEKQRRDIINLLIKNGADLNLRNEKNETISELLERLRLHECFEEDLNLLNNSASLLPKNTNPKLGLSLKAFCLKLIKNYVGK